MFDKNIVYKPMFLYLIKITFISREDLAITKQVVVDLSWPIMILYIVLYFNELRSFSEKPIKLYFDKYVMRYNLLTP